MSECWKCHREIPYGSECQWCEAGISIPRLDEIVTGVEIELVEIDWDKVQTVADVKDILRHLAYCSVVVKGSVEYHALKRYLKPEADRPDPSHQDPSVP